MDPQKYNLFDMIDKEMQKVLEIQNRRSENAFLTNTSIESMRKAYNEERTYWNEDGPEMADIQDIDYIGPHGKMNLRVYQPLIADSTLQQQDIIVFFHGGGFVVGNCDTHDKIMRILADLGQCLVVGVDYHLAPEYTFPVQFEECAEVLNDIMHQNWKFPFSCSGHVHICGDSVGAHLAMVSYLYLKNKGVQCQRIKTLILYYGYFGLRDSISRRLFGSELDGMRKEDLDFYEKIYLGDITESNDLYKKYVDLFNQPLPNDMANVFLGACELDPLLDDSKLMYELLKNVTTCELAIYPGTLHGFLHYSSEMILAKKALQHGIHFALR